MNAVAEIGDRLTKRRRITKAMTDGMRRSLALGRADLRAWAQGLVNRELASVATWDGMCWLLTMSEIGRQFREVAMRARRLEKLELRMDDIRDALVDEPRLSKHANDLLYGDLYV